MTEEGTIFIDGDFKSELGDCEYHCSPSCHPAQTGPDWVYGCTHKAWPQNKHGDFCPIVRCGGYKDKCDLKGYTIIVSRYRNGLKRRVKNAYLKANKYSKMLDELDNLVGEKT